MSEQNWLNLEKQESNPSQTWRRLRDQSITAINDLILLAKKLPEDKQKEIFSPARIEALIAQVLDVGELNASHKDFNARKSELAARLIKRGIDLNVTQYAESSSDTQSLIKPTLDHLKQTVSICYDISYKMKLKKIEAKAEGSNYQYLFSWNNMLSREEKALTSLISSKTKDDFVEILKVQNNENNRRVIDFGIDTGDSEVDGVFGTFQITINDTNTAAEACIFNAYHQLIWKDNLLVKEAAKDIDLTWRNNLDIYNHVQDYRNDFYFYIKKEVSNKSMKKLK